MLLVSKVERCVSSKGFSQSGKATSFPQACFPTAALQQVLCPRTTQQFLDALLAKSVQIVHLFKILERRLRDG